MILLTSSCAIELQMFPRCLLKKEKENEAESSQMLSDAGEGGGQ